MSQTTQTGSGASVFDDYKALAKFPEKIFTDMYQTFETIKPNRQEVANAIIKLIELQKGY